MGSTCPDRRVDELNKVEHRHGPGQVPAHLQQASGIGRDHRVRRNRHDVGDLAPAQFGTGVGLHHVVDPRRTAAELGFRDLGQFQAGWCQHRPRLNPDALAMRQMAGVVVGDPGLERVPRRDGSRSTRNSVMSRTSRRTPPRVRRSSGRRATAAVLLHLEPQPAALTMMASSRRVEDVDQSTGAVRASASRPACA